MKACQAGLAFLFVVSCFALAMAAQPSPARAISESKYTTAHSLGDEYKFDPRDGWETVNVTNLDYKYKRGSENDLNDRAGGKGVGAAISGLVKNIWKGLKGIGDKEAVTITWYTGHDLENPSCWANGKWAPTDASFAAALTQEGWTTRPKCFKFLELCSSPKKCVFVRVIDTCAGCAPGSKHVDLTRAAFGQLADFDTGVLKVQLRMATEPDTWYEKLWGPQVKGD
ncbi:Non-catalytic module family EXPN protein [Pholiota molesta]|nr:Non-catalytic module family EXPN protein [Pholiota molesta]